MERAYQAHVWSACEADPVFADAAARAEKLGVSAELEVAGGRGTDEIVDTIIGIARKTAGNLSGPPCQLAVVGFLGASHGLAADAEPFSDSRECRDRVQNRRAVTRRDHVDGAVL